MKFFHNINKFKKNQFLNAKISAFTLAEVLITLGIIGVVAALTIPALTNRTQDAEFKVAFKKDYATIAQAVTMALNENGGTISELGNGGGDPYNVLSDIAKYLKLEKRCGDYTSNPVSDCFISTFYDMAGNSIISVNGSWWVFAKLSNGGSLRAGLLYTTYDTYEIDVDVNGTKGPNIIGKDIFGILMHGTQIKPVSKDWTFSTFAWPWVNVNDDCHSGGAGWHCSTRVINGEDY